MNEPRRAGPRRGLGRGLGLADPDRARTPAPATDAARGRHRLGADRRARRPTVRGRRGAGAGRRLLRRAPDRPGRAQPVQPRQVFDEEAMAELVHSIREVGLLQPVVVRQYRPESLRAGHGRAPLARRPGGRPRRRSRRSSARPTTPTCCATRCWRTCTAPSSTRWRRPRPTAAARGLRLHPRGAGRADRPLATPDQQHDPAAQALAGGPAPGRRRRAVGRATPGRCSPSRTPTSRTGWRPRVVAEGISVRGLEEIVAVGEPDRAGRRRSAARKPTAPGPGRPRRPALRPARDPGQGRPRPAQGQDHRGVRLARRPAPDRRHHGPAQPQRPARSERPSIARHVAMSTKRQSTVDVGSSENLQVDRRTPSRRPDE